MNKILHPRAHEEARKFVELFWHDLPTGWHDQIEVAQWEMEIWLINFVRVVQKSKPDQLTLLKAARLRAETYYQRELKQVHHTPVEWAFFRFRLELAILHTCNSDKLTLLHCYSYADLLASFAHANYADSSSASREI